MLAALFDLSGSVIAVITAVHQRRNTGGSRKDYIFSEFATLAIFNPTAAIDTQHTTNYRNLIKFYGISQITPISRIQCLKKNISSQSRLCDNTLVKEEAQVEPEKIIYFLIGNTAPFDLFGYVIANTTAV